MDLKNFLLDRRLNLIFQNSPSGVLIIDKTGTVVLFNKAAERISCLQSSQVIGRHLTELNLPVGLLDVLKTGQSDISRRHQYNHVTFIANRSPIKDDRGKIIGAISMFQDLSEFEYLSEELKMSKEALEQLQTILEASYDGFLITDQDGVILQANSAVERLIGLPAGMIIGRKLSDWPGENLLKQDIVQLVTGKGMPITIMEKTALGHTLMITGSPVNNSRQQLKKIVINIRDLSEVAELRQELMKTQELVEQFVAHQNTTMAASSEIIANSAQMKDLLALARKVARVDSTVMLRGESGVGKELVANYIYQNSKRYNKPYIKINCGAIPEQLLESELFGYESGSFTGAKKGGKPGLFELADQGTVFLDEISELPLSLQVKLLRVLQEQEFNRIGGLETKKVDVRIIAATNRDLSQLVAAGEFREDLFFRLNVVPIEIPPLRERKEDIIPLLYWFLDKFTRQYNLKRTLAPGTINLLMEYSWPGNIRELSNVMERLVVISSEQVLKPSLLPDYIRQPAKTRNQALKTGNLKEQVADFEKAVIKKTIAECGSTHKAAEALGISPSTLFRKLKE